MAGLVAGLVVILLYLLYDAVRMAPLATPVAMAGLLLLANALAGVVMARIFK